MHVKSLIILTLFALLALLISNLVIDAVDPGYNSQLSTLRFLYQCQGVGALFTNLLIATALKERATRSEK